MGKWLTYEENLEYHREYNARYRKEHPERLSDYQKKCYRKRKENKMKDQEKEDADAKASHRITLLTDEYESGSIL